MPEPLGEAVLKLTLDEGDLDKGIDSAKKKTESIGESATSASQKAALAIGGIGLAAGAGLAAAISSAANFEHAIDAVGAVAQATDEEMKGLADTGLRIGKDTAYSATEAATAMEILAANGISAQDIMNGAADAAVNLAAAGGTTLATAADVASTSMTVWGLSTSDMTDVVNRLAGAANVSRFGVDDMSQAVAMGGGAAKLAGVEFGDFATTIAAIAPSFSSGSDAGTSFKQFLSSLSPTSKPAIAAMMDLGLITEDGSNKFYDANGNLKSMADVTQVLHDATAGLSEQQRTQALSTIFGSDAMRAASAISQLTGDQFAEMDRKMAESDAAAIAAKRMGNLQGSMESLKGSVETIMITVGSAFLPVLTKLANFLAENLPKAFEATQKAIGFIIDNSNIFIPIGGALAGMIIGALVPAAVALTISFGTAAAAILVALAPFLLIGAAIGALVAGVILIIAKWDELTARFPILQTALDLVVQGFTYLKDRLSEIANNVVPLLQTAFSGIQTAIGTVATFITGTLLPALTQARDKFVNDVLPALQRIGDMFETVGKVVLGFIQLALIPVQGALETLVQVFRSQWDNIKGVVETALNLIKTVFESVFNTIKAIAQTGIEAIRDIISIVLALIRGDWEGAWEGMKTFLSNLWDNIKNIIDSAWTGIKDIFKAALDFLGATISTAWQTFKDLIATGMQKMWEGIQKGWETIKQLFADVFGNIMEKIGSFFGDIVGKIRQGMSEAWLVFNEKLNDIIGIFQGMVDKVKELFNGLIRAINSAIGFINSALDFTVEVPGIDMPGPLPDVPAASISVDTPDIPTIPELQHGTSFIPRNMTALLHKGEAVIPSSINKQITRVPYFNPESYFQKEAGAPNVGVEVFIDGEALHNAVDTRIQVWGERQRRDAQLRGLRLRG